MSHLVKAAGFPAAKSLCSFFLKNPLEVIFGQRRINLSLNSNLVKDFQKNLQKLAKKINYCLKFDLAKADICFGDSLSPMISKGSERIHQEVFGLAGKAKYRAGLPPRRRPGPE